MKLEYEGYRVDETRSGQDGIEKATKTPYDAPGLSPSARRTKR
jgi:CheY-like chemotaxis protein